MQTQQQRMAVSAHERILTVEDGDRKKYGTMAHKLPMLIRNAGLAQALVFVEARGESAQKKLLQHLAETIDFGGVTSWDALVELSRTADLATYMLLTRRVMAALVWYKRFTESILKVRNVDDAESLSNAAPAPEA